MRRHDIFNLHVRRQSYAQANVNVNYQQLKKRNEPGILHNLNVRYGIQQIYTYTGPILIALNPYQSLPIYSKQMISQYCGQRLGRLSPHVFAVAGLPASPPTCLLRLIPIGRGGV